MPLPSVQYALSEVGRSLARFDPRELHAGLSLLANNPRPGSDIPHGPWEPIPGIYVNTRITKRNARHSAAIAAATKVAHLRALAETYPDGRAGAVARSLMESIPRKSEIEESDVASSEHIGGGVCWPTPSVRIHVSGRRRIPKVMVWVTNDVSWLFPDDPRLWDVLVQANRADQRAIILARKIAFSTFPLLKRLGGFGLQVHHLYMPGGVTKSAAAERAFVGGPLSYAAEEIRNHVAIKDDLRARLNTSPPRVTNEMIDGLELAAKLGLHSESHDRTDRLRTWTSQSSIAMPPPWKAQLTRYVKWRAAVGAVGDETSMSSPGST